MTSPDALPSLTPEEQAIYAWQTTVRDFGEEGQRKLKAATVLVSRVGGLGSLVALELAAAGVGHLVLAHGGNLKPSDLNRQILQVEANLGRPRLDSIVERLRAFNPRLKITALPHQLNTPELALDAARDADVIVDAAPLFEERFSMNTAAVRLGIPLVDCAMYETSAFITTIQPGQTGCLRCLYPNGHDGWTRRFPVFGAVSGTVGCLGAMEAIKLITGLGRPLAGELLTLDLEVMDFRKIRFSRNPACACCGASHS